MIGDKVKAKAKIGYESRFVINPKTVINFQLILIKLGKIGEYSYCSELDIDYYCNYNNAKEKQIRNEIERYLSEYNSNNLTHTEAVKETIKIEEQLVKFITKMHED